MKRIYYLIVLVAFMVSCSGDEQSMIMGVANLSDGTAIAGATVKLYDEDTQPITQINTDAEGGYSFTSLRSGNYYIGATVTVDGEVWDTGNLPQLVFVSDEIVKEVALTLSLKSQ